MYKKQYLKTKILGIVFSAAITFQFFQTDIGFAQTDNNTQQSDSLQAEAWFKKGESLLFKAQHDSSIYYYEKAGDYFKTAEIWSRYIQCRNKIAENYWKTNQFTSAKEYLNTTIKMALKYLGENNKNTANIYEIYGIVSYLEGDYNQALEYYHKALLIRSEVLGPRHSHLSYSYYNMGLVYSYKMDHEKAFECFEKALSIRIETLGENHAHNAGVYREIGAIYHNKGQWDKALEYYQKALSIELDTYGARHPQTTYSYNHLGVLYNDMGDFQKALEYHNKSLSIKLELLDKNNILFAPSYHNIGTVYEKMSKYKKALTNYEKALSITKLTHGDKHPDVARCVDQIGVVYLNLKSYKKALDYFKQSLSIRQETLGNKHPELAKTLSDIGKVYENQNYLARALEYYQKSIIALVKDFDDSRIHSNPTLEDIGSKPVLLQSLNLKAEALEKLHTLQPKNLEALSTSVATYALAIDLIDQMRQDYHSEESRMVLADQSIPIYKKAIQSALKHYQLTQDDHYKIKAFQFAEKSKAGMLLQTLLESRAKHFAGIPDELLKQEQSLKIDLAFYKKCLFEETAKGEEADSAKTALWQNKLFTLNREYEDLIQRFEKKYPNYYNLKYNPQTVSPDDLQKKILKKDEALVEYFLGDNTLTIFHITKQDLNIKTVDIDKQIEEQVNGMREGLTERDYPLYTSNAYRLYQTLIKPIEPHIQNKTLIIIPDGILGYVPFETLITQQPEKKKPDYQQLAYLIKDHQISYHYSATILYENAKQAIRRPKQDYLGFAPVVFK